MTNFLFTKNIIFGEVSGNDISGSLSGREREFKIGNNTISFYSIFNYIIWNFVLEL